MISDLTLLVLLRIACSTRQVRLTRNELRASFAGLTMDQIQAAIDRGWLSTHPGTGQPKNTAYDITDAGREHVRRLVAWSQEGKSAP